MKPSLPLVLSLTLPAHAQSPTPTWTPVFSLHTAIPAGALHKDVQGQFGFGFGLGAQVRLWERGALRGSFSWTGYRVNDRNLAWRMWASLLDADYREDRVILRSYALGVDFVGYSQAEDRGLYLVAGGGFQRARLYAEERYVDSSGNETITPLATWPAATTPYLQAGLGYQGHSGLFSEAKAVFWRYRAVRGYPLLDTPLGGTPTLRQAVSFTLAIGVRL